MSLIAHPRLAVLAVAAASLLCGADARAQSSPYYIGIAQSLGYESNLYKVGGNQGLPAGAQNKSDTISSTSLVVGVDQTWGRQRLSGSGSLNVNRYASNDQLNYNGHGLNLGLDWATVERLSGRLAVSADRSLRSFDPALQGGQNSERNVEDNNMVSGTVRVGVVTRLTGEASLSRRSVRYTAAAYDGAEFDQTSGSLGVRYRLGGATTVGLAWRQANYGYITSANDFKRRDVDLTGTWEPSGLTNLYARLSSTRASYDLSTARNFSGATGELRASTQASGKVRLNARLSRDLGQASSTFDFQGLPGATEFNRTGTALRVGADYDLTSKIALNASAQHLQRSFDSTRFAVLSGSDRTSTLSLGARWLPTRSIQVGCSVSHEHRSVSVVGNPYSSSSANCYGQFILQ